jgi:protein-disulfide isomerase
VGESAVKRVAAALVICLLGAAVSGLLLMQHHGEGGAVSAVNQACGDGQTSGCEEVARSSYSKVAGMPLAAIGLFFYLSLALLLLLAALGPAESLPPLAALAVIAFALALLVDLGLLALQAFSIKAFCKLCLATYALNAAALAVLWPARRAAGELGTAARRAEGRLVIAAWAVATLAVAGGVLGSEAALIAREAQRASTLLGQPTATAPAPATTVPAMPPTSTTPDPTPVTTVPKATPTPTPVAGSAGELQSYKDTAKRLQDTLDDPQKLEAYFADKAAKEFDKAPVQALDLKDVPVKGPANAPIQVVGYSDFLCPFCRGLAGALAQYIPQSGNRVAVYFKNYPLEQSCNPTIQNTIHPGACVLALGGICASYQGKFEPYHDRVFGSELKNPQAADVVRLAGEAGLNAAALESCLSDPRTKEQLAAQVQEAKKVGVQATPTLFINGKKLPRINDFLQTVEKEAQRKGLPPLAPPAKAR